jgi:hypothetical protein
MTDSESEPRLPKDGWYSNICGKELKGDLVMTRHSHKAPKRKKDSEVH